MNPTGDKQGRTITVNAEAGRSLAEEVAMDHQRNVKGRQGRQGGNVMSHHEFAYAY